MFVILFAVIPFACSNGTEVHSDDDFAVGKEYYGFELIKKEFVSEIKAYTYRLKHIKTGAEVLAVKNNDDNKTFGISFKTFPDSSNGVAHILEHSVLQGSEKYPVRGPFWHMSKSSLYTFKNAMTYPDRTVYPVSSRNKKDYFNLMNVYLDAVLNPLLTKNTFLQEGWRYELESADAELKYNGVVYNEMKASSTSVSRLAYYKIMGELYPDTLYNNISGGDPKVIPELTYEEFKDFHSKYYHPSNSYIYFYGDVNLNEELSHVNENFLSKFDKKEIDDDITPQEAFTEQKVVKDTYPLKKGENIQNKSLIELAHSIETRDKETIYAMMILTYALYYSNSSPLKRAIINNGLSNNVTSYLSNYTLQPYVTIILKDTEAEHTETFKKLYYEKLNEIVENGIDEDLLLSIFNAWEFGQREEKNSTYRGLGYYFQTINNWTYDEPIMDGIKSEAILAKLRDKIYEDGYYENLIKKYLLDNKHSVLLTLVPDTNLMEEIETQTKEELKQYKKSLSDEEIQALVEQTQAFKEYQTTPDSKEALSTLPQLSIKDIPKEIPKYPNEIVSNEPLISYHDIFSNRIAYMDLWFDTKYLTTEEIKYLYLFGDFLIKSGTDKTSYADMEKKIMSYTGNISGGFSTTDKYSEFSNSYFTLNTKVLVNNYGKLSELLKELIQDTSFSDTDRIKELLNIHKSHRESYLRNYGNFSMASERLSAYISDSGKAHELVWGTELYSTIKDALDRIENEPEEFKAFLTGIKQKLFRKDNLIVNLTIEKDHRKGALKVIDELKAVLFDDEIEPVDRVYPEFTPNEAIVSSSQVQYVGMAINAYDYGIKNTGAFRLLHTYLKKDYLHKKVREEGGAYGCFSSFNRNSGIFNIISYRDPQIKKTYDVYKSIGEHLENLELSEEDFKNLKITTSKLPLRTPDSKGRSAFYNYIYGYTYEDDKRIRKEILDAEIEDLRAYADFFKKFAEKAVICTVGSETAINENKDLFSDILKPLE